MVPSTDLQAKFLISSKPYFRKKKVKSDKSINSSWETHYRFKKYDLFITTSRSYYIPPIMDSFMDITIGTMYQHSSEELDKISNTSELRKLA